MVLGLVAEFILLQFWRTEVWYHYQDVVKTIFQALEENSIPCLVRRPVAATIPWPVVTALPSPRPVSLPHLPIAISSVYKIPLCLPLLRIHAIVLRAHWNNPESSPYLKITSAKPFFPDKEILQFPGPGT